MPECGLTQTASWSSLDFPTTLEGISTGETLEGPFSCPDCEDRHVAHSNLFTVIDVRGDPTNTDYDPKVSTDGGHSAGGTEREAYRDVLLFRVLFNDDRTRIDTNHDVMGWGVRFPAGWCYVDWNREGTGGDIDIIHEQNVACEVGDD